MVYSTYLFLQPSLCQVFRLQVQLVKVYCCSIYILFLYHSCCVSYISHFRGNSRVHSNCTKLIATAPTLSRFMLLSNASVSQSALLSLKSVIVLYSIWNLDFFVAHCILHFVFTQERLLFMIILSLDYIIGAYSLFIAICKE